NSRPTRTVGGSLAAAPAPDGTAVVRLDGTINAGGNVRGRANGKLAFDGLVGAAAGGFVGVGISVLVGAVAEQTDARIGSTASISAGGDVSIKAEQTSTTHAFGFAGGGGLVGVGGQVVVLSDSSTQHAHVDAGAVVKKALGTLAVKASSTRRVDAFAVGGAIGGVAAGAAIAIATIGGSTTAMIGDSCGGACTAQVSIGLAGDEVHNVSVTAQSDDTVSSKTLAVAAGAISLSGAVAYSKVDPAVSATIANTDFLVTGDVTVLAYSQDHVKSQSYGANIGAVALGAAVSLATSDPTTTASLTTTTNVEAGGVITVEARHDHDGASALAGEGAVAEVTAGSGGGLFAGIGAVATADADADTSATLSASGSARIMAGGAISARAKASNEASANVFSVAIGLVGVGSSFGTATAGG